MGESVWVVDMGDSIVGAYSSRENAERIAARIRAADPQACADVIEWPLDPGIEALDKGLTRYLVAMRRNGTIKTVEVDDDAWAYGRVTNEIEFWPGALHNDREPLLVAHVFARDEQEAIRWTDERRRETIASGLWPKPAS